MVPSGSLAAFWPRKYPDQPVLDDPPCDFNVGKFLFLGVFPERRVEGRFLGAVSLSSMTSLA